jgi:Ca2+-binding EF-hand superfamily protein
MFDSSKAGKIENEKVRTILNTLGLAINDLELEALLEEEDKEGKERADLPPTQYSSAAMQHHQMA